MMRGNILLMHLITRMTHFCLKKNPEVCIIRTDLTCVGTRNIWEVFVFDK